MRSTTRIVRTVAFTLAIARVAMAAIAIALASSGTSAHASEIQNPELPSASAGNPLLDRLKAARFNCVAKSVGQICTATANAAVGFRYPQPISVLVPAGVQRPHSILLYLHGFRGVCPATNATPEQIEADWQLTQQMISGGAADSVLLFPMSQGNCSTYDSALLPRFQTFLNWGRDLLQPTSSRLTIAGHSGAGARMANALSNHLAIAKETDAVFLLDATYGMSSTGSPYLDKWAAVALANPRVKIFTRYLAGTATDPGSQNLKKRLPNHVDSAVSAASRHCRVPAVEIKNLLQKRSNAKPRFDLVSF